MRSVVSRKRAFIEEEQLNDADKRTHKTRCSKLASLGRRSSFVVCLLLNNFILLGQFHIRMENNFKWNLDIILGH